MELLCACNVTWMCMLAVKRLMKDISFWGKGLRLVEFTNDKPAIAALQHLDVAKVMKRQHNQQPHKNHLCEPIQVKSDNGDASVNPVAMAVAEADVDFKQNASMMIDLNSRPLHMQGQSYNSSQNVRDMEVLSSSNGESAWVVPKISPKGKDPSQCR
eukprot:Gb_12929 [translate_table: standard]